MKVLLLIVILVLLNGSTQSRNIGNQNDHKVEKQNIWKDANCTNNNNLLNLQFLNDGKNIHVQIPKILMNRLKNAGKSPKYEYFNYIYNCLKPLIGKKVEQLRLYNKNGTNLRFVLHINDKQKSACNCVTVNHRKDTSNIHKSNKPNTGHVLFDKDTINNSGMPNFGTGKNVNNGFLNYDDKGVHVYSNEDSILNDEINYPISNEKTNSNGSSDYSSEANSSKETDSDEEMDCSDEGDFDEDRNTYFDKDTSSDEETNTYFDKDTSSDEETNSYDEEDCDDINYSSQIAVDDSPLISHLLPLSNNEDTRSKKPETNTKERNHPYYMSADDENGKINDNSNYSLDSDENNDSLGDNDDSLGDNDDSLGDNDDSLGDAHQNFHDNTHPDSHDNTHPDSHDKTHNDSRSDSHHDYNHTYINPNRNKHPVDSAKTSFNAHRDNNKLLDSTKKKKIKHGPNPQTITHSRKEKQGQSSEKHLPKEVPNQLLNSQKGDQHNSNKLSPSALKWINNRILEAVEEQLKSHKTKFCGKICNETIS